MGPDRQAPEGSVRRCLNVRIVIKAWNRQEKALFGWEKNLLVMIAGGDVVCIALLLCVFLFPLF